MYSRARAAATKNQTRRALRGILARDPSQFEALTLMGYIEARLEDYAVAANYYERALAVPRSPSAMATRRRPSSKAASSACKPTIWT